MQRHGVRVLVVSGALVLAGSLAACGTTTASSPPRRPSPVMVDRDVLTPGEGGSLPADADSTDQIPLYDGLTPLEGDVTPADLETYFKDDPLGATQGRREKVPLAGLTIIRDRYDVPHIFGRTRADAEFGAGWVAAEDRGLVLQYIRGAGAIAALDVPGINAFGVAGNLQQFDESASTRAFLASEIKLADHYGAAGRQVLADAEHYVDGINAYFRATHSSATPWTVEDVVAATALIGAVFGRGGGNQVADSSILADIEAKLGAAQGLRVFDDLREQQNPLTPTTIAARYPYELVPTGPTPGSAVVDRGSVEAVSALTPRRHMSNALLLGPGRTAAGTSVAVMGPQVGYYYPEILLEMDLHAPGLDARGAAFPGTSLYVEIGRGPNFAWSATSSDSENVDQYLDKLCNPDGSPATRSSDHYLYDGRCVAMTTVDAGYLEPRGSSPGGEVVFRRTIHGPVSGTCTVGGVPYAITTKRSTYGRDVMSALGFEQLNDGSVHSPQTFIRAASDIEFTFNWFYVDAHHVAFFSSGRLPVRAAGTNPTLPTFGTGQWEWRGFLTPAQHPEAIDPAGGELVNWNNQPARDWGAASDNWGEGPIDHVLLLTGPIPAGSGDDAADLVSAMNQAATQDPRGELVWPTIAKVLAAGTPPDGRAEQAAAAVTSWVDAGAHLPESADGSTVASPGAAILNAAWSGLVAADLSPVLGSLWSEIPGDGMSYLYEDLHDVLGEPLAASYSREYCGDGNLAACARSLWAAIAAAADRLAAAQGADLNDWSLSQGRDTFLPGILPESMRYSNRPTFQQVVWFEG